MQRILQWTKGVPQYQAEFKDLEWEKPQQCKWCGCKKFYKWGKYKRYVIEEDNEHRIPIQRIYCVKCCKTYSYLPSFCVSKINYSADFIMTLLSALIMKIKYELGDMKRRAYIFLERFVKSESEWIVFLRAKGVRGYPKDKKERTEKIFTALLEYHKGGNLLTDFFREMEHHFMSVK